MKNITTKLINKIKKWYKGKYIPPRENEPDSPIFVISTGHYEQSLLAQTLKTIWLFWFNHWKWIIGTSIALTALYLRLFQN